MRRLLALLALAALPAAAQQIDDPANLMGERVSPPALADTLPINHGAPALEQLLRKLRTRASMMFIVAHPDDEDSGLLTLESRGMGARVAMLTLTRGEGGQNLMSADFNDALGLIRTQELLAEDRYTGVDQFFGTEVDFGFSKTKEESFAKWTHDRVLYDAVRAVRLYRPLVLASTFIGGVTDGHGQHQVSGEICQEVFKAAADPKVFPEMGLPPWAPLRVYARVPFATINDKGMFDYATGKFVPPHFHNYVTGTDSTTPPQATVVIHEGEVPNIAAFEGKSYIQFARQGLGLQKSQVGPDVRLPPSGRADSGYTLMGFSTLRNSARQETAGRDSSSATEDLFTGIDTSLQSMSSLAPSLTGSHHSVLVGQLAAIDRSIAQAQLDFSPDHVERTIPRLLESLKITDELIEQVEQWQPSVVARIEKFNLLHELRIKRVQLNKALVLAHGLTLTASLVDPPPGQALLANQSHLVVSTKLNNSGASPLLFDSVGLPSTLDAKSLYRFAYAKANLPVTASSSRTDKVGFERTPPLPATRPYFSRPDLDQPFYDVSNPALRNAPETPAPLTASVFLDAQGVELEVAAVVADPFLAMQPVAVVPPVTVNLTRTFGMASSRTQSDLQTTAEATKAASEGIIPIDTTAFQLNALLGVQAGENTVPLGPARIGPAPVRPAKISVKLIAPPGWKVSEASYNGSTQPVLEHFDLSPSALSSAKTYRITAEALLEGRTYEESFRPVGYPGLTYTNYYTPATYRATAVDVTTAPNLRVAYLPGTGDDVPQFLPSLGVTPTLLTTKDLTAENLKRYDAVVLGVRAYAAHPELAGAGSEPLKAYAKAGGIVIAQYDSGGFNPASAPFPYTLPGDSAHNVVDEDQPVALLDANDPLLTWPNRITSADFDRWVEERGHGFASDWAPEYKALLETHDPEQDPQKGGLLLAKVGRGAYIYCAFAFYRQLPEGVPGAYRLVANLLSYAKNPGR